MAAGLSMHTSTVVRVAEQNPGNLCSTFVLAVQVDSAFVTRVPQIRHEHCNCSSPMWIVSEDKR